MANGGKESEADGKVNVGILFHHYQLETYETFVLSESKAEVLIGSNAKADIQILDPNVSQYHCILSRIPEGWTIKDNKSDNGTFVDGLRLQMDESFLLQSNSNIYLGDPGEEVHKFRYVFIPMKGHDSIKPIKLETSTSYEKSEKCKQSSSKGECSQNSSHISIYQSQNQVSHEKPIVNDVVSKKKISLAPEVEHHVTNNTELNRTLINNERPCTVTSTMMPSPYLDPYDILNTSKTACISLGRAEGLSQEPLDNNSSFGGFQSGSSNLDCYDRKSLLTNSLLSKTPCTLWYKLYPPEENSLDIPLTSGFPDMDFSSCISSDLEEVPFIDSISDNIDYPCYRAERLSSIRTSNKKKYEAATSNYVPRTGRMTLKVSSSDTSKCISNNLSPGLKECSKKKTCESDADKCYPSKKPKRNECMENSKLITAGFPLSSSDSSLSSEESLQTMIQGKHRHFKKRVIERNSSQMVRPTEDIKPASTSALEVSKVSSVIYSDGPSNQDLKDKLCTKQETTITDEECDPISSTPLISVQDSSTEKQNDIDSLKEQLSYLQTLVEDLKLSNIELEQNLCIKTDLLDKRLAEEAKLKESFTTCRELIKNELTAEMKKRLEDDLSCNICTELLIKPTVMKCSHTFCEYCIQKWRKRKNECPICRKPTMFQTKVLILDEFIDKTIESLDPEAHKKRKEVVAEREKKKSTRANQERPGFLQHFRNIRNIRYSDFYSFPGEIPLDTISSGSRFDHGGRENNAGPQIPLDTISFHHVDYHRPENDTGTEIPLDAIHLRHFNYHGRENNAAVDPFVRYNAFYSIYNACSRCGRPEHSGSSCQ